MKRNELFRVENVTKRIVRIIGISGEMMYLVIGSKKAALLDSGVGVGNIREVVESITDKEIVVILTHGHVDHISGAGLFDNVYLNKRDYEIADKHLNKEVQIDHLYMNKINVKEILEQDFIVPRKIQYKNLEVGDVFDLGDITLEICEGRGHTQGQITVLIKEERFLLLGDACNDLIFMFMEECSYIQEYKNMLVELQAYLKGKYDYVLLSHGKGTESANIISEIIDVCDDILCGNVDDIPIELLGCRGYFAKAIDKNNNRLDGKNGNIVYKKA